MNSHEICKQLWAKTRPFHPLWCHMLDTAAVCSELLKCIGAVPGVPDRWVTYLAALHDIGKADPRFQNKDDVRSAALKDQGVFLPECKEPYRHEARSGDWAFCYLQGMLQWDEEAARLVMQVLRGHHGNFRASCYREEEAYPDHVAMWVSLRQALAEATAKTLALASSTPPPMELADSSATGARMAGMVVLSDWIASNSELFRYPELNSQLAPDDYWKAACKEAGRAVDMLQLRPQTDASNDVTSFGAVWPDIKEYRPSQQALEEMCKQGVPPGLVIIEAPMGEGKTESAIFLAEHWRNVYEITGTYFALPTMATSNQMHGRYAHRPKDEGLRVAEGKTLSTGGAGARYILLQPGPESNR